MGDEISLVRVILSIILMSRMFANLTSLQVWAGGLGSSINLKLLTWYFLLPLYVIINHLLSLELICYIKGLFKQYILRGLHLPYLEARYV